MKHFRIFENYIHGYLRISKAKFISEKFKIIAVCNIINYVHKRNTALQNY